MDNGYTELSQEAFQNIRDQDLTPQQVVEYIYHKIPPRAFHDILLEMYPYDDLRERLVKGLQKMEPERSKNTVELTVSGWLNGTHIPDKRQTFFQISYILNLSEHEADKLLSWHVDYGIHYRNPLELVLAFGLRANIPYADVMELYKQLPDLPKTMCDMDDDGLCRTQLLRAQFQPVNTWEEFLRFYQDVLPTLGIMHNTAYNQFKMWWNILQNPDKEHSDNFSIDTVLKSYLRMNVPFRARLKKPEEPKILDRTQKLIKRYWPSATQIKDIKMRHKEVSRKILLLLYLAVGGVDPDTQSADDMDLEEDLSPEDQFEERVNQINSMMGRCGMRFIDPRAPFDWLVLYCLKTDEEFSMDERMASLMRILFSE